MGPGSLLRQTWELIPVLFLLLAGGLIALRSGVDPSATTRGVRQFFGNLSQMVFRLVGYVALLLALQYWIGMRPLLGW